MSIDLYFDLAEVLVLVDHARSCGEHVPSLTEQDQGHACPGGLEWVADDGVYLMSTGCPPLPGPAGAINRVVHAHGWDTGTPRRARADTDLGGDDFVEHLHLDDHDARELHAAHAAGSRWLLLKADQTQVQCHVTRSGPR